MGNGRIIVGAKYERTFEQRHTVFLMDDIYNQSIGDLTSIDCSRYVLENRKLLLTDKNVLWGIPFALGLEGIGKNLLLLKDEPVEWHLKEPLQDPCLLFLHTADFKETLQNKDGLYSPMMGTPRLGEVVCQYVIKYTDGTSHTLDIKRRLNISEFAHNWGENALPMYEPWVPRQRRQNINNFF